MTATTEGTTYADRLAHKFFERHTLIGDSTSHPNCWRDSLKLGMQMALREAEANGHTLSELIDATHGDVADIIIPVIQRVDGQDWNPARAKQLAVAATLIDVARVIGEAPNVGTHDEGARNLRSDSPALNRPDGITGANDFRLDEWASDGDMDLYPTVDEQNAYLAQRGVIATPYTTGSGKDYVGMWMDYKRYKLPPEVRPFEVGTEWLVNDQSDGGASLGPDGARVVVVSNTYPHGGNNHISRFGPIKVVATDGRNPGARWTRRFPSMLMKTGDGAEVVAKSDAEVKAEELADELTRLKAKHRREMETVFEALRNEAERRDWCSEFEDFLDGIDHQVSIDLDEYRRSRDFEVSWTETYTVNVRRSVTITADNAEAAEEEAREGYEGALDDYELADALRYNASCDKEFSDSDDWTVESS